MITAKRLHEGVPQLADLLSDGVQFVEARNPPLAIKGMGKLVEVRPDLAQMAQKPGQFLPLDRWPPHGSGTGAAQRQGPQIGSDAESGLPCRVVDFRPFFGGAPNGDKAILRVADAFPAPPRGHGFGTRVWNLARHGTPP